MIVFLTTRAHRGTLAHVLRSGMANIHWSPYDSALNQTRLPIGTYVFTDLDRLTETERASAATWYRRLKRHGHGPLNDPARYLDRLALLQRLHAEGINPFTAYRATPDVVPARWPVFLRRNRGHDSPLRELHYDLASLRRAMSDATAKGFPPDDLIVVEFCATPLECGLYRKLSVYRVGSACFADSCVHSRKWVAKIGVDGIAPAEVYADELRIMRENPYGPAMMRIFDLAGVAYGRIDFGLVDGEPRIYEINTNPNVEFLGPSPSPHRTETRQLFRERYLAALAALQPPT